MRKTVFGLIRLKVLVLHFLWDWNLHTRYVYVCILCFRRSPLCLRHPRPPPFPRFKGSLYLLKKFCKYMKIHDFLNLRCIIASSKPYSLIVFPILKFSFSKLLKLFVKNMRFRQLLHREMSEQTVRHVFFFFFGCDYSIILPQTRILKKVLKQIYHNYLIKSNQDWNRQNQDNSSTFWIRTGYQNVIIVCFELGRIFFLACEIFKVHTFHTWH